VAVAKAVEEEAWEAEEAVAVPVGEEGAAEKFNTSHFCGASQNRGAPFLC